MIKMQEPSDYWLASFILWLVDIPLVICIGLVQFGIQMSFDLIGTVVLLCFVSRFMYWMLTLFNNLGSVKT